MAFWKKLLTLFGSPEIDPVPVKCATRKKPDTTKLTQYHYDFILYARREWEEFNRLNPKNRKSIQDLADAINDRMGTHKSLRALSRVWTGELNRDDLPQGKPTFDY